MKKQKKFTLREQDMPTKWYNIQAEMPTKPMDLLNPQTREPMGVDDLAHIFSRECAKQELDKTNAWIDIPEDVQEKYSYYDLLIHIYYYFMIFAVLSYRSEVVSFFCMSSYFLILNWMY